MPWEMCHQYHKYNYLGKCVIFPSLGIFLSRISHWKYNTKDYDMPMVSYPFTICKYLGNPRQIMPFLELISCNSQTGKN